MTTKLEKKLGDIREKRKFGVSIYLDDITKLKPLGQTVILKDKGGFKEQKRKSGIIITTRSSHPIQVGEVVTASNGWFEKGKRYERFFDIPLKKGDKVLFYYFGANKLRTKKGDFLLSTMKDIVGIVDD